MVGKFLCIWQINRSPKRLDGLIIDDLPNFPSSTCNCIIRSLISTDDGDLLAIHIMSHT